MPTHLPNNRLLQVHHIAVAVACGALFLFIPFITAFLISLFLVWLVFHFDSRIVAGVAIAFLVTIPILLSLGQDGQAEQIAVYAYFLLAITVALQIIEFKRTPRRKPTTPREKATLPIGAAPPMDHPATRPITPKKSIAKPQRFKERRVDSIVA